MLKFFRSKIFKILLVVFIISAGTWGYFYFYGNNNDSQEINYSFNIEGDYELEIDGEVNSSGSMNLLDGKIIAKNNGLQQKFSIGELGFVYSENGEIIEENIKNFDIISDSEKVYYYLEEGFKKSELFSQLGDKFEKMQKSFESKKYVMTDNSKPILEILGELSENDLIKKIVVGLVTSNPSAYFEQNNVYEELNNYLTNDEFINYLFVEGDKTGDKVSLSLNKEICNDYFPVFQNFIKELGQEELLLSMNIKDCNQSIEQLNSILPMLVQLYKQGDIENGNFELSVIQGNILDIKISYKEHIIDTWNISIVAPDDTFIFKMNGTKDELLGSTFKIDIEEEGIKIFGEIIDGLGKIDIDGDLGYGKISGIINILDYKLLDYDIKANAEQMGMIGELIAKGNTSSGSVNCFVKAGDEEIMKGDLSYIDGTFDLDLNAPDLELKSNYQKDLFYIKLLISDIDLLFDYNIGILKGHLNGEGIDAKFNGEFKGTKDYNFNLVENNSKVDLDIKGISKNDSEVEHSVLLKSNGEINLDFVLNQINSVDGLSVVSDNKIKLEFPIVKTIFNSNFKVSVKNGGAEYIIPENYDKIEFDLDKIFVLPNILSTSKVNKNIIIAGTALVGVGGTVAYLIGFTAESGGLFELSTKIESDDGYRGKIYGNYNSRNIEKINIKKIGINKVQINLVDIGKLKVGNNTNLGKIFKISSDGTILTLNKKIKYSAEFISLIKDDDT